VRRAAESVLDRRDKPGDDEGKDGDENVQIGKFPLNQRALQDIVRF
jgi:hypothetical protein